ncbi:MAG: hypothetical protein VKP62_09125 [Candidatus Sericytochromatia bacterium]|nr:hypothetical protein [Candidatus Sericytochromatia bacterium]
MSTDLLIAASALAITSVAGAVLWVAWQAGRLLDRLHSDTLPRVHHTLEALQVNLQEVERLTRDVDTTVSQANEIVEVAHRSVQGIESGIRTTCQAIKTQGRLRWASACAGLAAAWQVCRSGPDSVQEVTAPAEAEPCASAASPIAATQ